MTQNASFPLGLDASVKQGAESSLKACPHWRQKSPKTETKSIRFRRQMDTFCHRFRRLLSPVWTGLYTIIHYNHCERHCEGKVSSWRSDQAVQRMQYELNSAHVAFITVYYVRWRPAAVMWVPVSVTQKLVGQMLYAGGRPLHVADHW